MPPLGVRWSVDSDGDVCYEVDGVVVEHHRRGFVEDSPEAGLRGWVRLLESALAVLREGGCPPDRLGGRARAFLKLVMDDGNFGRGRRFRYFFRRLYAVGLSAPVRFAGRWAGLAVGRIKRIV